MRGGDSDDFVNIDVAGVGEGFSKEPVNHRHRRDVQQGETDPTIDCTPGTEHLPFADMGDTGIVIA